MIDKKTILNRLSEAVNGTEELLYTTEELDEFAWFYTDKWDDNTSEDVIAESFVDFWWHTDRVCRRCTECGSLMREGYCINGGEAYYCEKCLHNNYSDEEWEEEANNNDQSYYTEWY